MGLLHRFMGLTFIERDHQKDKRDPYHNESDNDDREQRANEEHRTGRMEKFHPGFFGKRSHGFPEIERCNDRKGEKDDKPKDDRANEREGVARCYGLPPVDVLP